MSNSENKFDYLATTVERLLKVANEDKPASFRALVKIAGLNPAKDFVDADLRYMDFRDEDLRGFNFNGADLSGSDFRRAKVKGVSFNGSTLAGVIGLPEQIEINIDSKTIAKVTQNVKRKIVDGVMPDAKDCSIVKTLRFGNTHVRDLSALKFAKNLQELSLVNTPVSDLSALSRLPQLKKLRLDNSRVENLNPISSIVSLRYLTIRDLSVSDISPICSLTNLNHLFLRLHNVREMGCLKNLSELSSLAIHSASLEDLSFLAQLRKLKSLTLLTRKVKDYSYIGQMKSLENLSYRSHSRFIDFVADIAQLKQLYLSGLPISRLPRLADSLEELSFGCSEAFKLQEINRFPALKSLSVRRPAKQFVENMHCPKLESLYLHGSSIGDDSAAYFPATIKNLGLFGATIENIENLVRLRHLERITIFDSPVADITPLVALKNLKQVHIANTKVKIIPDQLKNIIRYF